MPSPTRQIVAGFVALALSFGLQTLAVAQDATGEQPAPAPDASQAGDAAGAPATTTEATAAPEEPQSEAAPVEESSPPEDTSYQDEAPPAPRINRSLLYSGLGVFLGSFALSAGTGESVHAEDDTGGKTCSYCDKGRLMWIPLAGPWLLLPHADTDDQKAAAVAMGLMQVGGVALLIAGIVDVVSSKRKHKESKVAFRVGATPSLAQAKLHVRF